MNKVILKGSLGERFGGPYLMDVRSAVEAVKALACQLEGFETAIAEGSWRITQVRRGHEYELDYDTLFLGLTDGEIIFTPVPVGDAVNQPSNAWQQNRRSISRQQQSAERKQDSKGVAKVIIGIVLIVVTVYSAGATSPFLSGDFAAAGAAMSAPAFMGISYGQIAMFGAAIALSGIAMLAAPSPAGSTSSQAKDTNSFLFDGVANVTEQGNIVPIVYGKHRAGSVVAASDLQADKIQIVPEGTYDGYSEVPIGPGGGGGGNGGGIDNGGVDPGTVMPGWDTIVGGEDDDDTIEDPVFI